MPKKVTVLKSDITRMSGILENTRANARSAVVPMDLLRKFVLESGTVYSKIEGTLTTDGLDDIADSFNSCRGEETKVTIAHMTAMLNDFSQYLNGETHV